MKILLSGASGFVGQNLLNYLKNNNHEIFYLKREKKTANDFTYEDISKKTIECFNTVIHLAGKAHDTKNVIDSNEYYEVNTKLSKTVYDAFLASDAKIFIVLSSVKAVLDHTDKPLTEDILPNPQTHYGKSKLLAEQYILSKKIPEGKRVYILRPCMIHGPGNKGNLNLLNNIIKMGIPYPLGAFDNKRSFLSIENLCFTINELINQDNIPSGIYHLADDEPISTNRLISLISLSLNIRPKIWYPPKYFIKLIAKVGDIFPIPLNSERLGKLTENYVVSNVKLIQALGKKLPISSEEGLKTTFNCFKNA